MHLQLCMPHGKGLIKTSSYYLPYYISYADTQNNYAVLVNLRNFTAGKYNLLIIIEDLVCPQRKFSRKEHRETYWVNNILYLLKLIGSHQFL